MKKLLVLLVVCFISALSFGQKVAAISKDALAAGKSTGVYSFVMPADVTSAQVESVKGYYKEYYTVAFDAKSHVLTMTLTQNAEMNIRVMNRMMVALEVRDFKVGDTNMTFEELYENYLK